MENHFDNLFTLKDKGKDQYVPIQYITLSLNALYKIVKLCVPNLNRQHSTSFFVKYDYLQYNLL